MKTFWILSEGARYLILPIIFLQSCLHEMKFCFINFKKDNKYVYSVANPAFKPSVQPLIQEETFKP